MSTLRQKKLARRIAKAIDTGEDITKGELLKASDYSASSQNNPEIILSGDGVKEELEKIGFSELKAKSVLAGILNSPTIYEMVTPHDQIRAAQEVFKVMGSYAPEKSQSLHLSVEAKANTSAEQLRNEYEEKLRTNLIHDSEPN